MTTSQRTVQARELPAVVQFQSYAHFERIDLPDNCQRSYLLTWEPLLWGGGALVWRWGRRGTSGIRRVAEFADRPSAQRQIERLICRRLQRRYERVVRR